MKSILFKPESIQAIIEGRKTQTRRVIKPQPPVFQVNHNRMDDCWWYEYSCKRVIIKPRYQVGEVVYIKEAIEAHATFGEGNEAAYLQGYMVVYPDNQARLLRFDKLPQDGEIKPSYQKMFMPEWAARYFIEITEVRAERLQEITGRGDDALAEGITIERHRYCITYHNPATGEGFASYAEAFRRLWNSINKEKWEANPWVWVYTFKGVE